MAELWIAAEVIKGTQIIKVRTAYQCGPLETFNDLYLKTRCQENEPVEKVCDHFCLFSLNYHAHKFTDQSLFPFYVLLLLFVWEVYDVEILYIFILD